MTMRLPIEVRYFILHLDVLKFVCALLKMVLIWPYNNDNEAGPMGPPV